jgi:outer membrane lipopolysaccharide assembly protein LptE/RlpB
MQRVMGEGRVRVLLVLLLLLSGCGYQFQVEGAGPVIGGSSSAAAPQAKKGPVPRLMIAPFENHTFEPNLEQKFTSYTRHEFSSGSGVNVVNEKVNADLFFKAQIITAVTPSLSFNQNITFEQRVIVTVKASVQDLRNGKEIWTQNSTGASEFFLTNDLQFNRVLQNRALEQAGRQIAEDLASRFLAHLEAGATTTTERPATTTPTGGGTK